MTPNTHYYQVTAKCGHVGKGNYVPINFAVKATSASEAAQIAKNFPRVKKHLPDSILQSIQITKREYKELLRTNRNDPYLRAKCEKDQAFANIEDRIVKAYKQFKHQKVEPVKSMKYRNTIYELGGKRSRLILCYVED